MKYLANIAMLGLISIACSGCALPVLILANPDQDILLKYEKPLGFKLTSASIAWEDATSIPIEFKYQVLASQKDRPPPPDPMLVKRIEDDVKRLVGVLKDNVPAKLRVTLDGAGVVTGGDYRITFKPTSATKFDNHLGLQIGVVVRISDVNGKIVWTTVLHAHRGYSVIGVDFTDKSDVYIENTLQMLLNRMRKAELVN